MNVVVHVLPTYEVDLRASAIKPNIHFVRIREGRHMFELMCDREMLARVRDSISSYLESPASVGVKDPA